MSGLPALAAEEGVPSVEEIARRISDEAEPDDVVLQMARAVRSRIVAVRHQGEARSCVSCRHRVSPGTTEVYIGVCINPVVTQISYRPDGDTIEVRGVDCAEERGISRPLVNRIPVCGPTGLLHEAMPAAKVLPRLRAYMRWRRLGRSLRH